MLRRETQLNVNKFLGIDILINRILKIEKLLGLRKNTPLKEYASDSAAKAAGLEVGDWYFTSTGALHQVR